MGILDKIKEKVKQHREERQITKRLEYTARETAYRKEKIKMARESGRKKARRGMFGFGSVGIGFGEPPRRRAKPRRKVKRRKKRRPRRPREMWF